MSITSRSDLDYDFARRLFWGRTFGLFIQEVREKTGRPVEEAARLAGMETSDWQAMEAGMAPDPEQIHPIADALGLGHDVVERLALFCQDAWER